MTRRELLRWAFLSGSGIMLAACQRTLETTANFVSTPSPTRLDIFTPTSSPNATATTAPEATPTNTPTHAVVEPTRTETPEAKEATIFDVLLRPFIDEATGRRTERAKNDSEYDRRVDSQLNSGRTNFLLFGHGDSHEPPYDKLEIASPSILSIDHRASAIDIISLTHDIRDPFIEEILGIKGQRESAQRLDQLLLNRKAVEKMGKFRLPQISLEKATGLSVDFQVHFNDEVMGRFIDAVGAIEINSPISTPLGAYWYEGRKHNEGTGWIVKPGPRKLTGREAVGYIKSIAQFGPPDPRYKPEMEHNFRKALVFEALQAQAKKNLGDNAYKARVAAFVVQEMARGQVAYDFDPLTLVVNNLFGSLEKLQLPLGLPEVRHKLYAVDQCCSDDPGNMPVHWVNPYPQSGEEEARKDLLQRKVYREDLGYEIPYGANPYGDLITNYWRPVRIWVKKKLLGQ